MLTQAKIDGLRRFRGNAFPVLSVYLNLGADGREARSVGARLRRMLRPIRDAEPTLDRRAMTSLARDLQSVMELDKRIAGDLGHGVAIFSCLEADLFEYITLPRKVWDVAVADARPYMRPLDAMLDEFHRYCAVVVDRRRARIFESYLGEIEVWDETVEEGRRVSNFGGWYGLAEYGVRRHAEEVAHRHYRETVALITELFDERRFDILLLGGHKGSVDAFLPFLPGWLAAKVGGSFVVDPHTATAAVIGEHCARLEEVYERSLEQRAVEQLFDRARDARQAVVGLNATLTAVNARAVDLLLIEGTAIARGWVCERCGWLATRAGSCPRCDVPLVGVTDAIDHAARQVVENGGALEHVFADTELRGHLTGALLRFGVPPMRPALPNAETARSSTSGG